jgi:hypothetical protein
LGIFGININVFELQTVFSYFRKDLNGLGGGFKDPHPLWEIPTFVFLTQFELCKGLLVVRLVPYQKYLNSQSSNPSCLSC